jgi:hypothetical protein
MLTKMTLSAATPADRRSDQARRSSRSWRYRRPERTKRAEGPLSPTVLIYGSAIKTSANSPAFNNMQFSNRRQTGGLTIALSGPREHPPSRITSYSSSRSSLVTHHSPPLSTLAFHRAGCYFVGVPSNKAIITESAQMKPARIE